MKLRQLVADCLYIYRHANDRLPIERCGTQRFYNFFEDHTSMQYGRCYDRVPAWLRRIILREKVK
jgi:hypothetical protein